MILAYSTNAYTRFSLWESLKRIAQLGFRGVEIMGDRPHLYPPDFKDEDVARLKETLRETGLKVTNINSFTLFAVGDTYLPSWIEKDSSLRRVRIEHTKSSVHMAAALGCNNISVPPGGLLKGMGRGQAMRLFHRGLEQVIPLAEELGVRLLVEPEPGLLLENSRQFRQFIRSVSSPMVGLNFDAGHFFCVGQDPVEALEELFGWIGHMHLEDIGSSREHRHLIPGLGAMDLGSLIRRAARLGYKGDMSLELYPYVDMPDEAGSKGLAYLKPILEEAGWPQ
ncbi:MAG: sugar phosphate isomerase/epimerase family protein [bacterium]